VILVKSGFLPGAILYSVLRNGLNTGINDNLYVRDSTMAKKGSYIYDWPRPMVTVDAVVFGQFGNHTMVLLIKRANEPFASMWALPGGFVEMDEELIDAAARELQEETGLKGVHLEQLHTFGTVGRDPRGRQITIVHMGVVTNTQAKINAGDDAAEAKWFPIDKLPVKMAFDHLEVIKFATNHYHKTIDKRY